MLDIKWIRENPETFDNGLARRRRQPLSTRILELDSSLRALKTRLQEAQAERNAKSKEIGIAKSKGQDVQAIMDAVAALKSEIQNGEESERTLQAELDDLIAGLPNHLDESVPDGADEDANVELRRVGTPPVFGFAPKDHVALGEGLGLMDFDAASRMSGSRFVVLKGALARLDRAISSLMLDLHTTEGGYTETDTPLLVRDDAVFGTGQLPKAAEDMFRTTNDFWLIPTSEVTMTNLVRDQILDAGELPLRFTALSPCFRSEAGAAGKDTRGMIRQHQFKKVELVSITRPEDSEAEHERLLGCAEEVLKRLGLAYRVVILCSGDTGATARKTFDIEVWLPGQDRYREISSCSNTGDFQARRMRARYREEGEKQTRFVHTLNGSGLAVGRTLIAVLENYQQEDGSIVVPQALRPYMGGLEIIGAGRG
ncbi:serine--tRNA ligase [Iodidimonas sp. SYSU 1G8]|uniref:serine--tRNA ligase n=1 Tax=Iodidimonas sp. SYSU 1G8 TaxID=3133967 RepID=UPI0031FEE6AD